MFSGQIGKGNSSLHSAFLSIKEVFSALSQKQSVTMEFVIMVIGEKKKRNELDFIFFFFDQLWALRRARYKGYHSTYTV